jgi:hypothetical protein
MSAVRPDRAVGVRTLVLHERGRWVVYMDIAGWREEAPGNGNPMDVRRLRVQDYPTRARAEIAARWMERTADRTPDVRWMKSL